MRLCEGFTSGNEGTFFKNTHRDLSPWINLMESLIIEAWNVVLFVADRMPAYVPADPTANVLVIAAYLIWRLPRHTKSLNKAMNSALQNIIPHMQFIRIQLNILHTVTNPVPLFFCFFCLLTLIFLDWRITGLIKCCDLLSKIQDVKSKLKKVLESCSWQQQEISK